MFKEFISSLRSLVRLDHVVRSDTVTIGEVETESGKPRLALRLPSTGDVVTLDDHAQAQLAGQWGIPSAHLERLPNELAAEELMHFSQKDPRELTIRTVQEPGQAYAKGRAILSGKYQPFDSDSVLETIEPYMDGWHVSSAIVNRDEMRLLATMPESHDVSTRRVGDLTRAGLMISNSEIGTMALRVEFSIFRLICTNGMITATSANARVRHIWLDRHDFVRKLRECVSQAGQVGEQIARRLAATHALLLPNLDEDEGKLQGQVVGVLRREGLWTQAFAKEVQEVLGTSEEASVFGLIQFLSDNQRLSTARLADRVHHERVAGRLMALA